MVKNLVAGHIIKSPLAERHFCQVGLYQMDIGQMSGMLIREFYTVAEINSEDLSGGVFSVERRIAPKPCSRVHDRFLIFQE